MTFKILRFTFNNSIIAISLMVRISYRTSNLCKILMGQTNLIIICSRLQTISILERSKFRIIIYLKNIRIKMKFSKMIIKTIKILMNRMN